MRSSLFFYDFLEPDDFLKTQKISEDMTTLHQSKYHKVNWKVCQRRVGLFFDIPQEHPRGGDITNGKAKLY